MRVLLVVYLVVAILVGTWSDAMDRRFGVCPGVSQAWIFTAVLGVLWPVTLPMILGSIATDGQARYVHLGDGCVVEGKVEK